MKNEKKYQELRSLKEKINKKLEMGTDFQKIRELMLYLIEEKIYSELKGWDNQLAMLDRFLNIWMTEKKKLPDLGIETDIFDRISSLADVERKYLRIEYCGMRVENNVPNRYREQALNWLVQDGISGIAIGKILILETKKKEENLIYISEYLKSKGDYVNALLMVQSANEILAANEKLLLEEANIWMEGRQWKQGLDVLLKIEKPSDYIKETIAELRQVAGNG